MTLLPTDDWKGEGSNISVHSIQNNFVIALSAGQPLQLNLSSLKIDNRKQNFGKKGINNKGIITEIRELKNEEANIFRLKETMSLI